MNKSHRKEVIIARIIFAAILLVLILLIVFAASFISKKIGGKGTKDSQTQIESQISEESQVSQKEESEEPESQSMDTQGMDTESSETESSETESSETESSETESSQTESSESEQPSESQDSESETYVWVTTTNVKFRTEPNTTSEVIIGLEQGTVVQMVSIENGWAKVIYDGHTGYIRSDLVKKKSVTEAASQSSTKDTAENQNASGNESTASGQATSNNSTASGSETSAGKVVVIDPGHQRKGDSTKEANGPGSSTMKARVTGGTTGWTTGVPEYELTLEIGLMLRSELESRGYTVYMTRTTHDVNISNKERAQYASSVNADIAVRLHGNGVDNTSVSGALTLSPSSSNPYVANLAESSMKLSKCVLSAYCSATGMKNKGCQTSDTMTGINWSTVPVTILEMGYMTNSSDDTNMQNDAYQKKMVQGIADGIDDYFGR